MSKLLANVVTVNGANVVRFSGDGEKYHCRVCEAGQVYLV